MTEDEIRACDNCDKIHEKVYKNGCKTCFGVVLIPFRACDMVRCCQTFDNGKEYQTDIALDEATEMMQGYAAVVNAVVSGSYQRPCDECEQKSEGCQSVKMKLSDITSKRKLPHICRPVAQLPQLDPTAEMYRKVRDIVICSDGVSNAERVSILELIKGELIRGMQSQLDEADQ